MGWKISLNTEHIRIWKRMLLYWLAFVVMGLITGWHLKPRPDEILFVLSMPAFIVIPYGLWCFAVAVARLLWPVGFDRWPFLVGRRKVGVDLRRDRLRNRP